MAREGFSAKARSRKHPRTHFRALRKQIKTSGRLETADGTVISRTFYVRFARLEGASRVICRRKSRTPFRYRRDAVIGREIDGFDALRN